MGAYIIRVEFEGLRQRRFRLRVSLLQHAEMKRLALKDEVVSFEVSSSATHLLPAIRGDAASNRRSDSLGQLVLNGEDILEVAIITLGPNVVSSSGLY